MNKAFVRESDGDDEEALSPSLKLPPGSKNYITGRAGSTAWAIWLEITLALSVAS